MVMVKGQDHARRISRCRKRVACFIPPPASNLRGPRASWHRLFPLLLELVLMENTRATKRARSSTDARPTVRCADDLWLRDGNIVLRAVSSASDDYQVFRVHKSVLSMHSAAFSEMFGQDDILEASSEKYEGVALVDLHDEAQDLEDFLRAIYYSECVTMIQGPGWA